jgi:SAM-dependent methyltransferase
MKVITDYPLALDSADYLDPFGSAYNNSVNHKFNEKLYELLPKKQLKIMDLGCAGGGFVHDCIKDGHIAIGIDGSDCPRKNNLGEWPVIPESLFNADISKSFFVCDDNYFRIYFDVITAWEVLEHISIKDIDCFLENVHNHLSLGGLFIVSINVASEKHADIIKARGDIGDSPKFHHRNIKDIDWWDKKLTEFGLIPNIDKRIHFAGEFIRGPGFGCCAIHTEERMRLHNLPIMEQWATINRVLEFK